MDTVSVYHAKSYNSSELDIIINKIFQDLDFKSMVTPQSKILIKPNLIMRRRPEESATTHPALVKAVAQWLRGQGCTHILLADSPGGPYTKSLLESVYNGSDMKSVAADGLLTLNYDTGSSPREYPKGVRCKNFNIIDAVLEADVIINMPKFKTHMMTTFSGACKNMLGCVPGLQKPELHFRFPELADFGEMLCDLCELISPTISIMDGIMAMEGNGPTGGNPRFMGAVLASRNPHALDLVASRMIGLEWNSIPTLAAAVNRGILHKNQQPELAGEDIGDLFAGNFKKPDSKSLDFTYKLPKFLQKPFLSMVSPKPRIALKSCIGCGKCAESCPAHTIDIRGKKAVIDYIKCIKCYCCHEMCPVKAINIKRFSLLRH